MDREDNHYARLGIPYDATPEEIRHAYRVAARRLHPDTNVDAGATELFLKIQESYEVLNDPARKQTYDTSLPPDITAPPPVSIDIQYSRETLQQLSEPQLIYVLMELTARPDTKVNTSPPLNVCLVIDCSTSMQGEYLDTVKSTAIELVRQLRTQDNLSVVTFSDRAEVIVPAGNRSEPSKLETLIRMLQTSGGTEIFKGLEAGYNEVFRLLRKDRINHIIMLTDGRTYGDEADCMHIAEQAANYGVGISALGIGSKWNDAFLDSLASVTGGSSVYVSKPKDLQDYLKGKFSGLGKSFVDRVTFSFEFGVGVEMRYAFRLQPDAAQLPFESPIQLGSIPLESTLGILMEFFVASVPPGLNIITLLDGHITVDIPTRNIPSHTLRSRLNRPTSVSPDLGAPPMAIMQAMSKITLFRMQERAQEDLATGNIEEATHRLQNIATHLLAQGERELADAVLEEAKHILQYQKISEEGKKRIKYGTRDLMLPSPHRSKILDDSTKEHFASEVGKGAGE